MVNEDAYGDAALAGLGAVPGDGRASLADNVADVWIGHARRYANLVPDRLARHLADALNEPQETPETADQIAARIDAKIEAFRSSITRYGEPPYGAGAQAYGEALGANDVLMDWVLGADEDHCDDCMGLADGSPYAKGAVPTWPKAGDTQCFDNCYCEIQADEDSWNAVFP